MNDQVSLLLQGYAAKRKLAELLQAEGFAQANQPPIAIAAHESIPVVRTSIKQTNKLFRKNRRNHELVPWNRAEPITVDLLRRTFLSRPRLPDRDIVSLGPAVEPVCAPLRHK